MSSSLLTDDELRAVTAIERSCSVVSVLACLFTIITFCTSRRFHKPINRLVFYASFGNLMTSVATLMSRDFTDDVLSPGCQVQGFLIQMFMPADALWTLAMATNVYLAFYRGYDTLHLRKMEIPYLLLCYGLPFIPALVFVFIRNVQGERVYGDAILWCWISSDWRILRIAVFYAPVWAVIIVTFFIYIRAGRTMYENHKTLRSLSSGYTDSVSAADDFVVTKTQIAHLRAEDVAMPSRHNPSGVHTSLSASATVLLPCPTIGSQPSDASYTVDVDVDTMTIRVDQQPRHLASVPDTYRPGASSSPGPVPRRNHAAWSYAKCSLLFFTAMLITWIPSSANRVYSIAHGNRVSVPLQYMSAFVLPLQGLWNAIIYAVTSWSACKNLVHDVRTSRWPDLRELVHGMRPRSKEPAYPRREEVR
ncbi:hypothetical protein NLG97_g3794 [Lecanicillium saksenae]|uniref:Uncharacterized protein n=1 Tax=Lecanicillium saksenae TaxID=468837 RepID=A0ACC1QY99_9HYPO|nr:hypothetical protein NLG97_g3794 [Lecanicillium saksenae]